jgi:O-antigen/teichoic acid export membrane protein
MLYGGHKRYLTMLVRYRKFPTYAVPTNFVNTLIYSAPLFLLSILYEPAVSGRFALVQRIVSAPMNVMTAAATEVFKSDLLAAADQQRRESVYRQTAKLLAAAAAPIALIGVLLGPWVITLALGERWREAGIYAAILAPMYAVRLIGSPMGYVLIFFRRLQLDFCIQLIWLVAVVLCFLLFAHNLSNRVPIALYSAVNCCAYLFYIALSWRIVSQQHTEQRVMAAERRALDQVRRPSLIAGRPKAR